jgi:hypothetical protein
MYGTTIPTFAQASECTSMHSSLFRNSSRSKCSHNLNKPHKWKSLNYILASILGLRRSLITSQLFPTITRCQINSSFVCNRLPLSFVLFISSLSSLLDNCISQTSRAPLTNPHFAQFIVYFSRYRSNTTYLGVESSWRVDGKRVPSQ